MTREEKNINGVLHVILNYTDEEKAAMKAKVEKVKAEREAKKVKKAK